MRLLEIKVAKIEAIVSTFEKLIITLGNRPKIEPLDAGKWYKSGENEPE